MSATQTNSATSSEDVDNIFHMLLFVTDDQREKLFSELRTRYCFNCGCEQPEYGCQCDNDE